MAQKKLLTNGKAFRHTDDRWGSTVWYMDENGERKRKSFSGTTKAGVTKKMTDYVAAFNEALQESDESRKTLKESMTHWLQVFKFPSVERTTYDRCECTVEHQIFPLLGEKIVGDITAADLKEVLNHWMGEGYAYGPLAQAGSRPSGPQHLTDHRDVLRQERYYPPARNHGRVQFLARASARREGTPDF